MKPFIRFVGIMKYLILLLFCVGCGEHKPKEYKEITVGDKGRKVIVERIGVFDDEHAYDGKRVIFLITDTKTDKQFIGVSGVGVSELGSHTNDDETVKDER